MDGGLVEHVPHVYRLALRLTQDVHRAEDLTQETFLRAWPQCHHLKNKQAIRAWLFRITINLMRDESRRQNSSQTSPLSVEMNCSKPTPDMTAETDDELAHALRVLDKLPTRQRVVLFLVAIEEHSLTDVCAILDITMTSAKANLSLARKRMREEVAKRSLPHSQTNPLTHPDEQDTTDD